MNDASLRSLSTLRANGDPQTAVFPASGIDAFVELLAGPGPSHGRAILTRTEGQPLALIYREAYRVASTLERGSVPGAAAPGALALQGVGALPLRPRAAVLLACVLGFSEEDIAVVLSTTAATAGALVEEAIALLGGAPGAARATRAAGGGTAA